MTKDILTYFALVLQIVAMGYFIFTMWRSNRKQKEFEKQTEELLSKHRETLRQQMLRQLYSPGGGVH